MIDKILLNAVTTTTTSEVVNLQGIKKVGLQLLASGISSGNGAFIVEISNDGTNWVTYNGLITNVTGRTVAAGLTLNANGSNFVFLHLEDAFKAMRVKVTVTTDGAYSAFLFGQSESRR